jgi:hypothetical protein
MDGDRENMPDNEYPVSLSLCKGVRLIQLVNVPFHLLEH